MRIISYLWIIPFIIFLAGYYSAYLFFRSPCITMPALLGTSIHQSLALLSEKNLNVRILAYMHDADLPSGTILQQIPSANEKIKEHQSIFLVLSEQSAAKQAPSLVHKELSAILTDLEKNEIRAKTHVLNYHYPKNSCFAQDPCAGEPLENKNLHIYIATQERKPILWPNFVGKSYEHVHEFLDSLAIVPEIIESPRFFRSQQRIIVDQQPAAGTLLIFEPQNPPYVQLKIE